MKLFFLLLSSLFISSAFAASCCVSNTSVSNLMIQPAKWQQTFTFSQSRVIGDVNDNGVSTFRRAENKDIIQFARLDLAYGWTNRYQSGVSLKYQNRERQFNGTDASDSGWNDIGLSHAYQPILLNRIWIYQTLNIPTSRSMYDSEAVLAVDARGSGTYQTSVGAFGIENYKEWDFVYNTEIHRSFARTFKNTSNETEVEGFWGGSVMGGMGFIPWRSKARYGVSLSPRLEGEKIININEQQTVSKQSLVWDTSFNVTYTFNAEQAVGINYLDQTIFGPVQNTLLVRSISMLYQVRWL